jgi:hypothetical protein
MPTLTHTLHAYEPLLIGWIASVHGRQHATHTQLLEQLLMGWTVGGMPAVGDDNGDDGEEHHHCCERLLAGWMGHYRQ